MPTRTTGLMRYVTEQRYGGPTRSIDGNPTLTTTPARVVSNKPDRVSFTIVNTDVVDVFVAIDGAVASNNGIRISAGGGFLNVRQIDDDTLATEAWFGIAASATAVVYVIETISDTILAPEQK